MYRCLVMVLVGACWGADVPAPANDAGADATTEFARCELPPLGMTVATLAGCARAGTADGSRGDARFDNPTNVVLAPTGVAYVTDFDSSRIRAVAPDGTTTTVFEADNFRHPFGIALAPGGKLYVETDDNDLGEHSLETGTLWLVDPSAGTAEVIARDLGRPRGLAVLPTGHIAMADHMHHVISLLDPATGIATVLAGVRDEPGHANGLGAAARFAQPYDLVLAPDGTLVVADMDNHRVRRVSLAGEVVDLAGSGDTGKLDGPVDVASFDAPQALAVLPDGVLYVTDIERKVVREIANGVVRTIAGDGTPGWIDAAEPRNARFYGLEGIDADATRLVITDGNIGDGRDYHHVRTIWLDQL